MNVCVICLYPIRLLRSNKNVKVLECSHIFHKYCINKYIKMTDGIIKCPLCRDIIENDNYETIIEIDLEIHCKLAGRAKK